MRADEFKKFTRALFEAFPGTLMFLRDNCLDGRIEPTLGVWARTLENITFQEAMDVLAGWIDGSQKPPEAYEREKTALVLRQVVLNERDKRRRRDAAASGGDQYEYSRVCRGAFAALPSLAEIYRMGKALRERMLKGEITESEMRIERERLIEGLTC